jgi:hypothetical protein
LFAGDILKASPANFGYELKEHCQGRKSRSEFIGDFRAQSGTMGLLGAVFAISTISRGYNGQDVDLKDFSHKESR